MPKVMKVSGLPRATAQLHLRKRPPDSGKTSVVKGLEDVGINVSKIFPFSNHHSSDFNKYHQNCETGMVLLPLEPGNAPEHRLRDITIALSGHELPPLVASMNRWHTATWLLNLCLCMFMCHL